MQNYAIDWNICSTYYVEANSEEEAIQKFDNNLEQVVKEGVGWRYKGVDLQDVRVIEEDD